MDGPCTYFIEVQGRVDEDAFNAASPLEVSARRAGPEATLLTLRGDQSGLVGLVRHLHRMGYVLLSVHRAC